MAEGEAEPEKKLVIDEDWKAQVEKEKAAARAQRTQHEASAGDKTSPADKPSAASDTAATDQPTADRGGSAAAESSGTAEIRGSGSKAADRPPREPAVPPASFTMLVSMLFTQAMAALGQIPDPASGKADIDRALAKHYIDTLGMLEEKTKGNLSGDEATMLAEALHALRMTFVSSAG